MQKCQHGLKISHFCIYEHCSSKQSSGCEDCVRRHHSHVGNSEIIRVEDVDSIAQKFSVQNSLKPKCRQLQEHVFGFFTLVKNQILQTIDIACKAMVNKIGYPFLSSLGHLSSYKKIKNKQYKKLSSKELRKFYKDTKSLNNDFVQSKEKQLYIEEIRQNLGTLQLLERLMKDYEACTKKLCKSFQHDSSSWKKVEQLKKYLISILKIDNSPIPAKTTQKLQSVSIQKKPMNTKESLETSPSEEQNLFNPLYQKNRQSLKIQQQKQKDLKKSPNKQQQKASRNKYKQLRNFSIDRDLNKKVEQCYDIKITEEANSPGYVSKEKQILERKQKLMKMMSLKEKSIGKVLELVNISPPPLLSYQKSPNEKTKKIQRSDPSFINENNKSPEYNLKLSSPIKFQNSKNHISPRCQYQRQPDSSRSFKQQLLTQRNQQVKNQESDQNQNDEKYKYAICRLPSSESNASETENFFKTAGFKNLKRELDSLISENDFNRISQTSQKQIVGSDVMSSEEQKSACLYFKALQLTKPEQIIKYLKASLKYNHKNISSAQHLSFIYNDQNKAKESLDLCNEYLGILTKLNASNQLKINFVVNKSAALNLLGRYSEAIMLLEEQSLHIEEAKMFKNLGDSYFHVGINEKCQYNYEKAVKLNPKFDEAMYNLAVCLYIQRNYFNADVWIKKSLQIQPKKQDYLSLYHQISKKLAQVHEENQYLN